VRIRIESDMAGEIFFFILTSKTHNFMVNSDLFVFSHKVYHDTMGIVNTQFNEEAKK